MNLVHLFEKLPPPPKNILVHTCRVGVAKDLSSCQNQCTKQFYLWSPTQEDLLPGFTDNPETPNYKKLPEMNKNRTTASAIFQVHATETCVYVMCRSRKAIQHCLAEKWLFNLLSYTHVYSDSSSIGYTV